MAASEIGSEDPAVAFMASAILVFTIMAAFCSSPQTAEINAHQRAATLMKWVTIGLVLSGVFLAIAVYLDKKRWPSLMGGALAGASMWFSYDYAKRCGLASLEPGTEG